MSCRFCEITMTIWTLEILKGWNITDISHKRDLSKEVGIALGIVYHI
ncbi:MAG: hypothetical protein HOG49_23460 [Candidatus Scalindua sp.]|jgi:hypothetical protein|nr:hypothetical protein [Candidatus Scalindua sp.]